MYVYMYLRMYVFQLLKANKYSRSVHMLSANFKNYIFTCVIVLNYDNIFKIIIKENYVS